MAPTARDQTYFGKYSFQKCPFASILSVLKVLFWDLKNKTKQKKWYWPIDLALFRLKIVFKGIFFNFLTALALQAVFGSALQYFEQE